MVMNRQTLIDVHELIEHKDWNASRNILATLPEAEIAELLFELDPIDRMIVFRLLPREVSTEVFTFLEKDLQNTLLAELSSEETRQLLASLSPDDRTQLFSELPGQVTQKLLNLLSPDDLKETRQLLGYPPESVGRLMTPDYVAVRPEWTIAQALDHIRRKGKDSETVSAIYVTDKNWKLLDALELRRFILAQPDQTVSDIMDYTFVRLEATQDREEAVRMMERYDLHVLPVVDSAGVLVGIVTFDDVMDVAQAEATEDFHKGAAVSPIQGSYREASFGALYRKRISWLVILVFVNIFSGEAMSNFEEVIAANVVLVFFLPLLIDSSGNAGSQAATLMVRALATGEVRLGDWWRLVAKDISVALALGLTMALAVSVLGYFRGGWEIAAVVSLTMVCVVAVGSIIGTMLPFLLSRLRFDPATASAPLITSLSDISGVIIYFTIATLILTQLD